MMPSPRPRPLSQLLLLTTTLLLGCRTAHAWLGDRSLVVPAMVESPGKVAQTVALDCTAAGAAIQIVQATYGLPCTETSPPCAVGPNCPAQACEKVEANNYLEVMDGQCAGKLKCAVSTCPCPKVADCNPSATGCVAHDPAQGHMKGVTVRYRCGAAAWGLSFLLALGIGGGAYAGGGVAFAQRVQGRRPAGPDLQAALATHPHCARWMMVKGLASDGLAFARGEGGRRGDPGGGSGGGRQRGSSPERREERGKGKDRRREEKGKDPKPRGSKVKKSKRSQAEPLLEDEARAPEAAEAKSTASGAGGRWVHVPN